ncbi:DNA photolyase [Chiua virens]|nr:DNA photolyase [Chiua virens]
MSKRPRSPTPASVSKRARATTFSPRRIATPAAAAAVQVNPPFLRLLTEMRDVIRDPQPGKSIVYWMRMGDLRIVDNRALAAASQQATKEKIPLIVLFLFSPQDYIAHDRSKRRVDFVLRNLSKIKESLAELDIPLHTVSQTPRHTIPPKIISLLESFQCTDLFANIEYEIDELRRDLKVLTLSKEKGIRPHYFHDKCIIEPGLINTKDGKTHTVYSPYQKIWIGKLNEKIDIYLEESPMPQANPSTVRQDPILGPLFETPVPHALEGFELGPCGQGNDGQGLAGRISRRSRDTFAFSKHERESVTIGRIFVYADKRDRGDQDTTSRLSPYLSAGVISPRECDHRYWSLGPGARMAGFLYECLSELSSSIDGATIPGEGKTGVPIVDAAMRQMNVMGNLRDEVHILARV